MRRFTPRYNEDHAELTRDEKRMLYLFKNQPEWKKQLGQHLGVQGRAKKYARLRPDADRQREAREEAEMQAAATLRKCIEALQMALDAINAAPAPAKYQSHVNVRALINGVIYLRDKCGLRD